MLIKYEEYKKDYDAYKKSEFIIPENEIEIIVDSLKVDVSESLPQVCKSYFDYQQLPKIASLLDKYHAINNLPQIKDAVSKFGYNATNINIFIFFAENKSKQICLNCSIGRPRT